MEEHIVARLTPHHENSVPPIDICNLLGIVSFVAPLCGPVTSILWCLLPSQQQHLSLCNTLSQLFQFLLGGIGIFIVV